LGLAAWALGLVAIFTALAPLDAQALPLFARQTGQNCVACHAGGQFPELTPYGRMFKMTGYTIGERQLVPLSIMYNADYAKVRNTNGSTAPQDDFQKNGLPAIGGGSLFLAGKVTDNIGMFIQDTYDNYNLTSTNADGGRGKYIGHSSADYVDIRYADHILEAGQDIVFGVSLNNRPAGTDPSSAAPPWMQYVPGTNAGNINSRAFTDAATYGTIPNNVAGINLYGFWNKTIYAELGFYQTANRWKSFLTSGVNDAGTPKLKGTNPYWRLALSHEWGAHNILVGTTGMIQRLYDSADTSDPTTVGRVKNIGLDAQYQYLLDPHTITTQLSYMRQTTNLSDNAIAGLAAPATFVDANGNPLPVANASNTLNTFRAKLSYVYRATYGGSVSFFNRTGTTDTAAMTSGYEAACPIANTVCDSTAGGTSVRVSGNLSGNPATRGFTYEAFVMPVQYVRVGVQYTAYNKYNGATSNYDGFGRNPQDNNTLYFYVWGAY
jgi:hypothetical protein